MLSGAETVSQAAKLLSCITSISTLITIIFNIWYLKRIKIRVKELKKQQSRIREKAKGAINKTIDLLSIFIKTVIENEVKLCKAQGSNTEEILKKIKNTNPNDFTYLLEKMDFIFFNVIKLSIYETKENAEKSLDSKLDESLSSLKLYMDRISDKIKNFGLFLNFVMIICVLLIVTITK